MACLSGEAKRDAHFSETNNDELVAFCRGTGLRRSELEKLHGEDLVSRERIERECEEIENGAGRRTVEQARRLEILRDALLFDAPWFVFTRGKGGRERLSLIIGKSAEKIVERMKNTAPEARVWDYVSGNADIHSYRADYAKKTAFGYRICAEDDRECRYVVLTREELCALLEREVEE